MQPSSASTPLQSVASDYDYLTLDIAALSQNKKINRYGYVVGGVGFLVPHNTLSEVLRKYTLYSIPNTKAWLRGLVNLRGNLIPAFDVSMLFGFQNTATHYENLLILDKGADAVGILINKLPVVCDVESWQPVAEQIAGVPGLETYTSEVYKNGEMIWSCFDHKAYFRSIKSDVAV